MKKTNFKPPRNKNDLTGLLSNLINKKKVSVYIDGANLYFAAQVASLKIDYKQLYTWFQSKSKSVKLNYYTAFDPEDTKQIDFLNQMEDTGYRIIKKPIKIYENFTKGNMDIELAVDALMQLEEYETLVLISGDGDFNYLVKALDQQGKKSIVLGIGGFTSFELHQEADNYFFLNRISKVWQTPKKVGVKSSQPVIIIDDFGAKKADEEVLKPKIKKEVSTEKKTPKTKTKKVESKKKVPVRLKVKKKSVEKSDPVVYIS